ncbi:MAG: hypothetical protein KKD39_04595 [Candidatus Altiarchaeota archaeon]|nr:hypothetical protein [Candidatus Altiarchaeota archaeon]
MPPTNPLSDARILIFDSDKKRGAAIRDALFELGYNCQCASNKDECIEELSSESYKFLFLGDAGDNLGLFPILDTAKKKNVIVNNFAYGDGEWSIKKAVSEIEQTLFDLKYGRN